jgi:hypothetical protein
MEASLKERGLLDRYNKLCAELDAMASGSGGGTLEGVCDSLRLLLTSCQPGGGVADKLAKTLPPGARVCVRSSAN